MNQISKKKPNTKEARKLVERYCYYVNFASKSDLEEVAKGNPKDPRTINAKNTLCILEAIDHLPSKTTIIKRPANPKELFISRYLNRIPVKLLVYQLGGYESGFYKVSRQSWLDFIEGFNSAVKRRGYEAEYLI